MILPKFSEKLHEIEKILDRGWRGWGCRGVPQQFIDKLMKLKEHQWILSNATLLEVSDSVTQMVVAL